MKNKQEYPNDQLPVMMQDWWLDICCGKENWKVHYFYNNEALIAVFPYGIEEKWGFKRIVPTRLVPYCGPYFFEDDHLPNRRQYQLEHDGLSSFLKLTKSYAYYEQKWPLSFQNAMAAIWENATISIRYTYLLDLSSSITLNTLRKGIKTDIKKAAKKLTVETSKDGQLLFHLLQNTFDRQSERLFVDKEKTVQLVQAVLERHCGQLYLAKDEFETVYAAIFIVWDNEKAYYLIGAADNKYRQSGAISLLLWDSIQNLPKHIKYFDFEGSQMPNVEHYFRGFGGVLKAYLHVSQYHNKWYKFLQKSFSIVKSLKR